MPTHYGHTPGSFNADTIRRLASPAGAAVATGRTGTPAGFNPVAGRTLLSGQAQQSSGTSDPLRGVDIYNSNWRAEGRSNIYQAPPNAVLNPVNGYWEVRTKNAAGGEHTQVYTEPPPGVTPNAQNSAAFRRDNGVSNPRQTSTGTSDPLRGVDIYNSNWRAEGRSNIYQAPDNAVLNPVNGYWEVRTKNAAGGDHIQVYTEPPAGVTPNAQNSAAFRRDNGVSNPRQTGGTSGPRQTTDLSQQRDPFAGRTLLTSDTPTSGIPTSGIPTFGEDIGSGAAPDIPQLSRGTSVRSTAPDPGSSATLARPEAPNVDPLTLPEARQRTVANRSQDLGHLQSARSRRSVRGPRGSFNVADTARRTLLGSL